MPRIYSVLRMMAWISNLKSLMNIRKKIWLSSPIASTILELNLNILLFSSLVKYIKLLVPPFHKILNFWSYFYINNIKATFMNENDVHINHTSLCVFLWMHTYVNGCYNLQMSSVSPLCMCAVCSFFLCLSPPLPTVLTSIRSRVQLVHCLVPALHLGT